jgi:hypothetical protein
VNVANTAEQGAAALEGAGLADRHVPETALNVIAVAVSIGISLLATLYPSGAVARELPAEALRNE